MDKRARWVGWRTDRIEQQVVARAQALAVFASGDPGTFRRYITQVQALIEQAEQFPRSGTPSTKRPSSFRLVISPPAPGSPDVFVYTLDAVGTTIVGEGTFSSVPPRFE